MSDKKKKPAAAKTVAGKTNSGKNNPNKTKKEQEKKKAEDALELYSKTFKQCNSFDEMCSALGFETMESLEEYVLNGRTYEEYFEDYFWY